MNRMPSSDSLDPGRPLADAVHAALDGIVLGKAAVLDRLLCALLAGGHVLLEDIPGVGKTLLVKALARLTDLRFARIQCTPDLLPAEVTGASVFDPAAGTFNFRPGPVFAHLVLVDEINRCSPRTQSALLEAMGEGQVTVDGETHRLPEPFMLVGTENPLDAEAAFDLPGSQLDRFLFRLRLGYPDADEQVAMLRQAADDHTAERVAQVLSWSDLLKAQADVRRVHVAEAVLAYIADLAEATRLHPRVAVGASPRAAVLWMRAAQAQAWLCGRSFVVPDDVRDLAADVLGHRMVLRGGSAAGDGANDVLADVLSSVAPPGAGASGAGRPGRRRG